MNDDELTRNITAYLKECGAQLVGVGNMAGIKNCTLPIGISVAIQVPVEIVKDLKTAPTNEYYNAYYRLNDKLNQIVLAGEEYLKACGYQAYALSTDRVKCNHNRETLIPHKTVATRAGLGWIGKNCLLVTKEYGPAIRLSSLMTDAPLVCAAPVTESGCGKCTLCRDACPAGAIRGTLWKAGMEREMIVDVEACQLKQTEIMKKTIGIETDLCGKCFAVCAFTQKLLR